jgi:hypothetical protein
LLHSRNFSPGFSHKFHQRRAAAIPSNYFGPRVLGENLASSRAVDEKVFDAISAYSHSSSAGLADPGLRMGMGE